MERWKMSFKKSRNKEADKKEPSPWQPQGLRSCTAAARDRRALSLVDHSAETGDHRTPSQERQLQLNRNKVLHITQAPANIYFRLLYLQHFQAHQLEAPLLKSLNDLSNKATLNSIWLYRYKSPLPYTWNTWWETQRRTTNFYGSKLSDMYLDGYLWFLLRKE